MKKYKYHSLGNIKINVKPIDIQIELSLDSYEINTYYLCGIITVSFENHFPGEQKIILKYRDWGEDYDIIDNKEKKYLESIIKIYNLEYSNVLNNYNSFYEILTEKIDLKNQSFKKSLTQEKLRKIIKIK
jgi:hypothetical protein